MKIINEPDDLIKKSMENKEKISFAELEARALALCIENNWKIYFDLCPAAIDIALDRIGGLCFENGYIRRIKNEKKISGKREENPSLRESTMKN